ncbi:hypothetical protein [Brucella intermedia]|uniref:hypothetical protein n=1 Tax=Brucella intermedia TaxID=94625 RepID=UPI00124EF5A5|nr:hypothetical protein [Brucella intermedia]KAB2727603.1 hypothetical protein F9L02_17245 [Brucella intermedia]
MVRLFSRAAFHQLVWSLPLAELAQRLAVPAWRICNLCRWHVIPMPGDRYWTRLAAGEPAHRTPLKPPGRGMADMVDIDSRMQPRSTYARLAMNEPDERPARPRNRVQNPSHPTGNPSHE